jgi:gliding motility-associated-like protein
MQFVRLASLLVMLLAATPLAAQWTVPVIPGPTPNSLQQVGNDCFQFTSTTNNRGVIWNNTPLDLTLPFDISFTVSQTPNGADGLAFVLQNVGVGAYGASGNANGFATPVPPDPNYSGIVASIGVELDCQDNSAAGVADIPADHIAVHENGVITSAAAGPAAAIPNGSNITDGICRVWRIVWFPAPTNRMDIYFDNQLRLPYTNDIVTNIFGGNPIVTWGLTGSSGGVGMTQTICVGTNFANAGPDLDVCPGTTQLNASGGTAYFWGQGFPLIDNQNIPNPNFTGIIPAPYPLSLLVTNATGCQDRDTVVMTVVPNPTADAGTGGNVCIGDSIQLGSTPNPDYAYAWSPTTGLSDPTAAQPWYVPTAAGPISYTLTVTDTSNSAGCTDTDNVSVTAFLTPSVSVAPTSVTTCQGQVVTLTATPSGGTLPYNFSWTTGGNAATESFIATSSGPVTVTVTDASACAVSASATLTVNDTAVLTLAPLPDTICSGNPVNVNVTATGGSGNLTYTWSTGQTTPSFTDLPAVTTTYALTVSDANGCESHLAHTVVVNPGEFVDIILPDTSVCGGGSIDINGVTSSAGITSYSWSPTTGVSNPNISTPVITPTASTLYVLTATNANTGCTIQDSIFIAFSDVNVTHWQDSLVCLGDSVVFDIQPTGGSGNYTYLWQYSPGNTLSNDSIANPTLFPQSNGTYFVTVTDTSVGCSTALTINVNVTQLQIQVNPGSALLNPGQHIELNAFGAMSYTWGPDTTGLSCYTCPNPTARPVTSVTYVVTGTDTTGCRGTATVVLSVDSLLIPNMFSPNGDGINDELELNYYGAYGNYEILIYDRWGHQIFATKDKQIMWNGKTAGGQDVPEGVYFLHVRILGDDAIPSKDKNRVFHVTLLR